MLFLIAIPRGVKSNGLWKSLLLTSLNDLIRFYLKTRLPENTLTGVNYFCFSVVC